MRGYGDEDGAGPIYACLQCGDVIQSKFRHDFVRCGCGAIALDGGSSYTKFVGEFTNFIPVDDPDYEGIDLEDDLS